MNTFTESLTERVLLHTAITPGFDYSQNPFVNPVLADPGTLDLAQRLGDNFQTLVASWAGSNFMTWGFNPLGDPGGINKEDPYSIWNRLLGGEYLGSIPAGGYTDYLNTPFNAAVADDGTGGGSTTVGTAQAEQWVLDVLKGLGVQATQENVCFMKSWQRAEGGHTNNTAKWNWLNVTTPMPGSSSAGTSQASIQKYPDYKTGVDAQVKTIRNGNYPDVVAGLQAGNILTNWSDVVNDLNIWHGAGNTASPTAYTNNLYSWTRDCVKAALARVANVGPARQAMLRYISAAEQNEPNWHYVFGGPDGRSNPFIEADAPSVRTDCSGYTTLVYEYARRAGFAVPRIPAQSDAQGAFAGARRVSGTYQVGDLCIYPGHVTVVASSGNESSATVSSHGEEGGPARRTGVNYRGDLQFVVRILQDD